MMLNTYITTTHDALMAAAPGDRITTASLRSHTTFVILANETSYDGGTRVTMDIICTREHTKAGATEATGTFATVARRGVTEILRTTPRGYQTSESAFIGNLEHIAVCEYSAGPWDRQNVHCTHVAQATGTPYQLHADTAVATR